MFEPQIARFRDHWRCITRDQRGHGRTASDSIAAFNDDDLAGLMTHLAIEHAVVAGMRQGAYVALRLALAHPQRLRGLILLNTQALPEADAAIHGYEKFRAIWRQGALPHRIADNLARIILGEGAPQAQAWKAKWSLWKPHNLTASFQALMERHDISSRLWMMRVPALVIHRGQTPRSPSSGAWTCSAIWPGRAWLGLREPDMRAT